jgi:von Willebrand factor A domain-containing protein 8
LKDDVPENIKAKAREMAQKELERQLRGLNMSVHDAKAYGLLLDAVQSHIASLVDLFDSKSIVLTIVHQEKITGERSCC